MTAVWLRARSELRARLGAVLVLALIVGVLGGVVIAAAAGARRTETAYPRFVAAKHGLDLVVSIGIYGQTTPQKRAEEARLLRQIDDLPQVAATSRVTLAGGELRIPGRGRPGNVFPIVSPDGRFGSTINGVKILQGRMYRRNAADEIVPSFAVANGLGLHVGETVRLVYGGITVGDQHPPGFKRPAPVDLSVVGIAAIPGMFQPIAGGYLPGVLVSSGFYDAHRGFIDPNDYTTAIVLRRSSSDLQPFLAELKRIHDGIPPYVHFNIGFNQAQQTAGIQEGTRTQAASLWMLAALVAIAGIAIFGQALARQTFLESIDYPSLRAMGVSPAQLIGVGMIRAAVVSMLGSVIAVVVAIGLSPLTPTGIARIAEPNPGFAVDGVVVVVGAIGTAVLVLILGAVPAWRAAWRTGTALGVAEIQTTRKPSATAGFMARAAFPPSATAGVRMALEPGRGRTAVPVRTATFGAALSLFALAAALSFGASLNGLISKPSLSGWNWDVLMFPGGQRTAEVAGKQMASILDRSRQVEGWGIGTVDNAEVNGAGVLVIAMDPRKGAVAPSVAEGHLPTATNQILLGGETMRKLGVGIGDTVTVTHRDNRVRMRIVGRVAIPPLFFSFAKPGQGAAMSLEAFDGLDRGNPHPRPPDAGGFFVRFAPRVDQQAFMAGLRRRIHGPVTVLGQPPSGQVSTLKGISSVPLVLAGIVALMAAVTLAHTLVTSIRRRRLDLAILKTLGFVRGQVSATVAWQATTVGVIAVVIGIPLGVMAGRWVWNVYAEGLGVVPEAIVPVAAILLAVPGTVLVANLLAIVPGRMASRLKAASVMRTE